MSGSFLNKFSLEPLESLARVIVNCEVALSHELIGLGSAYAIEKLLKISGYNLNDID